MCVRVSRCVCVCAICVYLLFLAVHTNYFKLNYRLPLVRTYWLLITLAPPLYCSTMHQRTMVLWHNCIIVGISTVT